MALTVEKKSDIINRFQLHEADTGSPEVQVAILSERITLSHRSLQDPTPRTTIPVGV